MVVHEILLVKCIETKVVLVNKLGLEHGLVVHCSLSTQKFLNSIYNFGEIRQHTEHKGKLKLFDHGYI